MRAVMLQVPQDLLAGRRRLGHDRFDEMWEGVLHMVPPPDSRHQSLEAWLLARWVPYCESAGLAVWTEAGVFDPAVPDFSNYRQPDVLVAHPAAISRRGVEGAADLVVEIRSADDEAYEKLPFYERVGVREVIVIERDLSPRQWLRDADRLVERAAARGGWVGVRAVPSRLRRTPGGTLEIEGPDGVVREFAEPGAGPAPAPRAVPPPAASDAP